MVLAFAKTIYEDLRGGHFRVSPVVRRESDQPKHIDALLSLRIRQQFGGSP